MINLLALDPGLECPAMAFFDTGVLVATRFAEPGLPLFATAAQLFDLDSPHLWATARMVIEMPQIYQSRPSNKDQNDLVDLAFVGGGMAAFFMALNQRECDLIRYWPHQWKGNLKKDECARRVRERLTEEELARVSLPSAKSKHHNVWDAVGIGLRALGRFGPGTKKLREEKR